MLRCEQIEKVYGNGPQAVRALRGIDLCVSRGEFVAVCGPSGSGKSTLLHILGLLDRPTKGRYLFEGIDVSTLRDWQLAQLRNRTVGFVFQDFNLLPHLTALQNVMLPLLYAGSPHRHRRAQQALSEVGLDDRLHHRPGTLSGGEKQRAAIARALVKDPALVLADEPTGNLDTQTGLAILDLLSKLHEKGLTLIVVTHDVEVARRADRLLFTRDGRIVREEDRRPA